MTGINICAWLLPLIGIRSALAHQEIATVLETIHILGNSYRLASSGVVSGAVYGRLAFGFCRVTAAGVAGHLASRHFRHAPAAWQTRSV